MHLRHLNFSTAELALYFQPSLLLTRMSTMILLSENIIKDDLVFILLIKICSQVQKQKLFLSLVNNRLSFSFKKL